MNNACRDRDKGESRAESVGSGRLNLDTRRQTGMDLQITPWRVRRESQEMKLVFSFLEE